MAERNRKKWQVGVADPEKVRLLQAEVGCTALLAHLLVLRGVDTPRDASDFLHPTYSQLADPFLLPDAEPAAVRLKQALNRRELISVHGDYDSDGVTSAALWTRLLQKLGGNVEVHVPHRHRHGYDMRDWFVQDAKSKGVGLIVTTDCGIQRIDEVKMARELGIDVIVTDHHEPKETIPDAVAVVNPHRSDSKYPFPMLAGVGVAFRMGEALIRHLGMPVESYRRAYHDLVAIGTVTDMMPLRGENRVLVKHGIDALATTQKAGLNALIRVAGLANRPLNSQSVGFKLGPRLNAIGRVDDARIALDLLLTRDPIEATRLADSIESANFERQREQSRITEEVILQVAQMDVEAAGCIVLAADDWNGGVIGIVANKIVERFHRPTLLIALDRESGLGRGSARAIRSFDLLAAITECGEYLNEFGGHARAAGFQIQAKNIEGFRAAMNGLALLRLTADDFIPVVDIDAEADPAEITTHLLEEMALLEPFGYDNPEPVFASRGLEITELFRIGKDSVHLKLFLRSATVNRIEAIMWGCGDWADYFNIGDCVDICYKPQINEFQGRRSVQFILRDIVLSSSMPLGAVRT